MDEEFSSALLTGCILLASDVGLYPARPAERFARRMPISLPQEASLAAHRLPPTNDPRVHPAYPGRPRGRAGHCPTTSRRRPSPHRNLRWPSTACASFEHEAPTQADHEPGMDAAGDHTDPGHPSRTAAPPSRSRTSLRPDTADAQRTDTGRPHRTSTPDAGQRTPGCSDARTGHWTPVPWTGKRGHWTLAPDTGHRTLDTGRGRGQADDGTAGIRTSWVTTPSDRPLGRPTVFLWTAPAALDSPCRLGREAPSSAR
jgi:hypothetical protein